MLAELSKGGPDSELVVKMIERVQVTRTAVVQPVQPTPQPVQPAPAQPAPAANGVREGSSEESALEVLDSGDDSVSQKGAKIEKTVASLEGET